MPPHVYSTVGNSKRNYREHLSIEHESAVRIRNDVLSESGMPFTLHEIMESHVNVGPSIDDVLQCLKCARNKHGFLCA